MKCKSIKCNNETAECTFCEDCLDGLLNHELHIDDLVPGLENSIEPTWERIKTEKRKTMKPCYQYKEVSKN